MTTYPTKINKNREEEEEEPKTKSGDSHIPILLTTFTLSDNSNNNNNNNKRNKRNGARLRVAALLVLDARNGRRIARRTRTTPLRVPRAARPALVADVRGAAVRVSCFVGRRRKPTSSESVAPYSCFGDVGPRAKPWPRPPYGKRVRIRVEARGTGGQRARLTLWIKLERR